MRLYDFCRALRIALACASKDTLRPQLNGVLLGADFIEGTDGHRMVRVKLGAPLLRTGFVTRVDARVYLERIRLEQALNLYDDGFKGPSAEHLPVSRSSDYPETERIWTMVATRARAVIDQVVWLNPRYLGTVKRIAKLLDPRLMHTAALTVGGPMEPVTLRLSHDELQVDLVLMPQRPPQPEAAAVRMLYPEAQEQSWTGFDCKACGHHHQGPRFAFICIGCPCEARAETPPELTAPGAGVTDRG